MWDFRDKHTVDLGAIDHGDRIIDCLQENLRLQDIALMYDIFMSLDLKTMLHDKFHGAEEEIPPRHVKVLSLYLLKESEDCRHQFVSKKCLSLTLSRFPWFQIFQVATRIKKQGRTKESEDESFAVLRSFTVVYSIVCGRISHLRPTISQY